MLKYCFIIGLFFSAFFARSQNTAPVSPISKLNAGEISNLEFSVYNGDTVYKKYTKKLQVIEQNDTIVYVEIFDVNRYWYLERYLLKNGKRIKSGWQQEFNIGGFNTFDRFCSEETGNCNKVNSYTYYPNGNIIAIVKTVKNKKEGLSSFYHNNGQLKNTIEFKNDKLWNVVAYFDQNGNILDPGNFCDGNGQVNVYSVTGKLIKIKTYKNGRERLFKIRR
jgi:hypothetical protein